VGHNDKERHENEGGFFGKDKEKESTGLIGKSDKHKDDKHTGLFGNEDKHKDANTGFFSKSDQDRGNKDNDVIIVGKSDRHRHDENRGGVFSESGTVEALVKSTLRENFNLSVLSHQITTTETSLSSSSFLSPSTPSTPGFIERAKEAVLEVKDKLTGDKSSPTSENNRARTHTVTP
ncbi:hypothetical protein PI125_g6132, partial [Phytophthora idaei]